VDKSNNHEIIIAYTYLLIILLPCSVTISGIFISLKVTSRHTGEEFESTFSLLTEKFADWLKLLTCAETSYLTDMFKSESSQKDESRAHSADPSKAYIKLGAFNDLPVLRNKSLLTLGPCFSTGLPRVVAVETDRIYLGRNLQPQFYAVVAKYTLGSLRRVPWATQT